jgi:2-C-methyl-D-erythritol 2,4-cyclodiphosphate synthase
MRIGIGYDIHKLEQGLDFVLGGVKIPYDKGFVAHSDGDVLLHAIIDAILGALGESDIGTQFPDNDPKYKGADSLELLALIKEKFEFKIVNLDCNIICEQPKMKPYIENMKKNIANV